MKICHYLKEYSHTIYNKIIMTCGIYILKFKDTPKVYVGQSINIEVRFARHRTKFTRNKAAKILQGAYNTYGMPTMEVLCECSIPELDSMEYEAISIFDSYNNGFNSTSGLSSSTTRTKVCGENSPNSSCSNETIEAAFLLVVENLLSHSEIASKLGISKNVVKDISCSNSHRWLQDIYPEAYEKMQDIKNSRPNGGRSAKDKGIVYPTIISPCGGTYQVSNLREFAREHNLTHTILGRVLRGQEVQHKGWKLLDTHITYHVVISPEGITYKITNLSEFASTHNVTPPTLSKLLNGSITQLKGWRLLGDHTMQSIT